MFLTSIFGTFITSANNYDEDGVIIISDRHDLQYTDTYIVKYDFDLNIVWQHCFPGEQDFQYFISMSHPIIRGRNNSYCFWFGGRGVRISADGDSVETWDIPIPTTEEWIIEGYTFYNDQYLGYLFDLENIYVLALNDSFSVIDTVFTEPREYDVSSNDDWYFMQTNEGNLLLFARSHDTHLRSFDADMNLQWTKSFKTNPDDWYFIPNGTNPAITLSNGDIFTCVWGDRSGYYRNKLRLIRFNPSGHFVGNEEAETPVVQPDALTCYPNPFNPTVYFEIKGTPAKDATLKIYNIKGQCVQTLPVNESKVTWTAENLGSGIYFIRLMENNHVIQTKKITLIK